MEEVKQHLTFSTKEFVFLEPLKTWLIIDADKKAQTLQCCICQEYLNAQSFKATFYPKGWNNEKSKVEYYCRKHAMKQFPNYFK